MKDKNLKLLVFMMNKIDPESVRWFFAFLNTGLLLIHLLLQFVYWYFDTKVMSVVNIFSVLLYLSMYPLLHRKMYKSFILIIYFEVLIHAIFGVIVIGWPAGFQLWLIALSCAYFFTTLVFEGTFSPEKLSWILTSISAAVFFALLLDSRFGGLSFVRMAYSGEDYFVFHFLNCAVTYFVVMFFSSMFVKGIVAKNNKLNEEAVIDKVTGLFNRLGLMKFIENSNFDKFNNYSVSIMDIDNFKSINDTYGHAAGDAALKFVGSKLKDKLDNSTVVCRWGGDEFLFIEFGDNHHEKLYNILEELREEISHSTIVVGNTLFSIKISAGIATCEEGDTREKVFYKADKALYESKASGQDRITKEG